MIASTFKALNKYWGLGIEDKYLDSLLLQGLFEANKALVILTNNKIDSNVFKDEYYANHPLFLKVIENWKNNIREKLIKYSFKPLAE